MLFMRKVSGIFLLLGFLFLNQFPPCSCDCTRATTTTTPQQTMPQAPKEEIMKGKVTEVLSSGEKEVEGKHYPYQNGKGTNP